MQHKLLGINDRNKDIIMYTALLSSGTNACEISRMKEILSHAIKSELTPRQRECVQMYFLKNMKMRDIARELCISPSTVTRHIKAGINNLKNVAKYY